MHIEHIAMYVNDLEKARDFLLNILMLYLMRDIIIKQRIFVHTFCLLMMGQDWR